MQHLPRILIVAHVNRTSGLGRQRPPRTILAQCPLPRVKRTFSDSILGVSSLMSAFLESGRFYPGETPIFRGRFRPEADIATHILLENFSLLFADPLTAHVLAEIRRPALLPNVNDAERIGDFEILRMSREAQLPIYCALPYERFHIAPS